MTRQTVMLEQLFRLGEIRAAPETADPEARTVEVVWSTGATVRRRGLFSDTEWDETLSLDPGAVRLHRLNGGAPLLNTHEQWDLRGTIGVVEKAWIAKAGNSHEGRALVRFSKRADVEPIFADVRDGIIRNVSVGYRVHKFERRDEPGKVPERRAVDWEPMEISLVPIGADAGAAVRSRDGSKAACEVVDHPLEDVRMDEPGTGAGSAASDTEVSTVDEAAIRQAAVAEERKRVKAIGERCRAVSLPQAFADELVSRGVALEHVGDAIVDELARRGAPAPRTPVRVEGGFDAAEPVARREAMALALASRYSPQLVRLADGARAAEYRGASILYMAEEHLSLSRNLSRVEIAKRALSTTSDFPLLLESALNKTLQASYQLAAPTFKRWTAQRSFKDFRAHKFYRAGDFPDLVENGESAEIQVGAIGEKRESVALLKYARRISLSREVLVNDDLGAFMDIGRMAGRRIADKENALVYAQLALSSGVGPTLADGNPVFHAASHANRAASGAAIDVTTVGVGRAGMRKQTTVDGLKMNLSPSILLTGPDYETAAQQFLSTLVVPVTDATINPFKGTLQPVADANISGNKWYLFAEGEAAPTFIFGYLEDEPGAKVETKEGWTTDGVEYRAILYFGTGAIDYRGGWYNPGA